MIWLEISLNNFKLLLCSAYRPPGGSNNFWDLFDYSIEQAFNVSQNIVIIGDLNIDLLRERNHRLNEIASFYELRNTIHEPTRMGSLLDPIFVSNCNLLIYSEVIQVERNISDHNATITSLKIPQYVRTTLKRKVWLYREADFPSLNNAISDYDWESFLDETIDVDTMNEKFTNKYFEFLNEHIVQIRQNDKPWFNTELRREMRKRYRLRRVAREKNDQHHVNKYKAQRNKVNDMVKYAREQFISSADEIVDSFLKTDTKVYWSLIKRPKKGTYTVSVLPPLFDSATGEMEESDKAKADLLNKYFCSISSVNDSDIDPPALPLQTIILLTLMLQKMMLKMY